MNQIMDSKRISRIIVKGGKVSFNCLSLDRVTKAEGSLEDVLKYNFITLANGFDYILNEKEKAQIRR